MNKSVVNEYIACEETDTERNINASEGPPRIFIPDLLAKWPWASQIHPDYDEMEKESAAWLAGFQIFSSKAQDAFNRCKYSLFTGFTYPNLNKESLKRIDIFNLIGWVLDEYAEKSTPSEVCDQKAIILDAFRNPHVPRPKGEWIGGEMARQFWRITTQNTTEAYQKKFMQRILGWMDGLQQESIDRQNNYHTLDINMFLEKRCHAGGVVVAFVVVELELGIPDEVVSHPAIQEVALIFGQIVMLCNDVASYNVEQMRGDESCNIITLVMNTHSTDVNGAMLWIQDHVSGLLEKLLAAIAALPHWEEPLNSQVKKYCDSLGQMIRGYWDWSFESEKYLGNKGPEIKKTRWMSPLPKKLAGKDIGPVHVDGSLL